jgi:integrase
MDRDLIHDAIRCLKTEESLSRSKIRGPATVKRHIAALSKLFSSAINWGWIDTNSVRNIQKPTEPAGRTRFLSEAERQALLAASAVSTDPYLHTVIMIALCTGARYGEIMNLCWADISFDRNTVTYRQTKNGDSRTCPVTDELKARLMSLKKVRHLGSSWVFPRFDGTKPKCIQSAWRRAVARAGVQDFRIMTLDTQRPAIWQCPEQRRQSFPRFWDTKLSQWWRDMRTSASSTRLRCRFGISFGASKIRETERCGN